ncbi:MAG: cytochrome c [Thioalkalivibrio sp.]
MTTPAIKRNLLLACLLALPVGLAAQQGGHEHMGHGDHSPAAEPQQPERHEGHDARQGHDGHGAQGGTGDPQDHGDHTGHDMGPRVTSGPWSYLDRDNPEPYGQDRWVMVPIPGIEAGYRFVRGVDAADVCAELDKRRIMVDRATREACGARPDTLPFEGVAMTADVDAPVGHSDHGAHDNHQGHGDHGAHGDQGTRPGHGDHGAQGNHGTHEGYGDHGGSGWAAPPDAVAMASPVNPDRDSTRRGQRAYMAFCISCHGADARGNGPAANGLGTPPADLVAHLAHHTDGDYAWKIRTGNGPMPAFEDVLSEGEIWDVVNYLRTLAPGEQITRQHVH